ncbi:MAG: hypothetical protein PUA56_02405 [Bacillales bacterium]|nr:hypothetical protein [Bacillales bacterium]
MKYYLPGILLFVIAIIIGVSVTCIMVFAYDEIMNAIGNLQNLSILIALSIILIAIFIGIGIYLIYKEYNENARIERLNKIGERKLGTIKNIEYYSPTSNLFKFDLEVNINNKKIHTFTSDFVSNHDYFLKEGYKLYVIYDKKNLKNYVIVYDKVIRN